MATSFILPDKSVDVKALDNVVRCMSTGDAAATMRAQSVLSDFLEQPDSWLHAADILQQSSEMQTKFFGLALLERCVSTRWNALADDVRISIRNYLVSFIIGLSSDAASLEANKPVVFKADVCLVKILKHDWPTRWPTFISELVGSALSNDALLLNNLRILMLLSEEIFDFGHVNMKSAFAQRKKEQLTEALSSIFELCLVALRDKNDVALVGQALDTTQRYLSWIPEGYIFESPVLELLLDRFLPVKETRTKAMKCLCEVAEMPPQITPVASMASLATRAMMAVVRYYPSSEQASEGIPSFVGLHRYYERNNDDDQNFIDATILFITNLLELRLAAVEQQDGTVLQVMLNFMVAATSIEDKEPFKSCVEFYWNLGNELVGEMFSSPGVMAYREVPERVRQYRPAVNAAREVLVRRMAKPEEVIIVEDEDGNVHKEFMTDVENLELYRTMRDTLVFFTHIDADATLKLFVRRMERQLDRSEWSRHNLNTLCWAVGSISGSMSVEDEKSLVIQVLKDQLSLCENMVTKEDKAVIASDIMYVVGQYPRFLNNHFRFLCTVVMKLREFMHESFPGVQDMAVDTLLKITKRCGKSMLEHTDRNVPFLFDLVEDINGCISDLDQPQTHVFYEAMGHIVAAASVLNARQCMEKLMKVCNEQWTFFEDAAKVSFENVLSEDAMRALIFVLRCNVRVAKSSGNNYMHQMKLLFWPLQHTYSEYSQRMNAEIVSNNGATANHGHMRLVRTVKKEITKLLREFIDHTEEKEFVAVECAPHIINVILHDYSSCIPVARDPVVLDLVGTLVQKLNHLVSPSVPTIFQLGLQPTLEMLKSNMEDFPDHRLSFFKLVKDLNEHCFGAFLTAVQECTVILDGIFWAVRHTEFSVMSTGLSILSAFLDNIIKSEVAEPFFKAYFFRILHDMFSVVSDKMHRAGFTQQVEVLTILVFCGVSKRFKICSGGECDPLIPATGAGHEASVTVRASDVDAIHNDELIKRWFAQQLEGVENLTPQQKSGFVDNLIAASGELLFLNVKTILADFLVELQEYAAVDEEAEREAREQREAAIPGLAAPVKDYVPSFGNED